MFARLLLLFTVVPLIELAFLVQLGKWLGLLPTIALVLVTGVIGAALARNQGWRTLARLRSGVDAGRMPTEALLDGLLILIAGAVLLTPGLLTDLFGFALLIPASRRALHQAIRGRLERRFVTRGQGAKRVIIVEPEDDNPDDPRASLP